MVTTTFSHLLAGALDPAFPSGDVVVDAFLLGAAIDNRPTPGTIISYDVADLRIPVTALTANPGGYLVLSLFPAIDGGTVNYASPNAANPAPASLNVKTYIASFISTTEIAVTDIPIPPYSFKLHVYNGLGVIMSIVSPGAQLQRRTVASW